MKYTITKIIIDNTELSTIEATLENGYKTAYSLLTDEPYDAEQILTRLRERIKWQINGLYPAKIALPCPNPYGDDNYSIPWIEDRVMRINYNIQTRRGPLFAIAYNDRSEPLLFVEPEDELEYTSMQTEYNIPGWPQFGRAYLSDNLIFIEGQEYPVTIEQLNDIFVSAEEQKKSTEVLNQIAAYRNRIFYGIGNPNDK